MSTRGQEQQGRRVRLQKAPLQPPENIPVQPLGFPALLSVDECFCALQILLSCGPSPFKVNASVGELVRNCTASYARTVTRFYGGPVLMAPDSIRRAGWGGGLEPGRVSSLCWACGGRWNDRGADFVWGAVPQVRGNVGRCGIYSNTDTSPEGPQPDRGLQEEGDRELCSRSCPHWPPGSAPLTQHTRSRPRGALQMLWQCANQEEGRLGRCSVDLVAR